MSDYSNLHVHVYSQSRDCDGVYDRTWERWFDHVDSIQGDFMPDISFHEWVVNAISSPYSFDIKAVMTFTRDQKGRKVYEYTETTEEGYYSAKAVICEEDCEPEGSTFRDHTAESMGY